MVVRNYWLLKTEPSVFGWHNQMEKNIECWSGVRNYQARNNLKAMLIGDLAYFYHTQGEKSIVGIVEIVKTHYPDPTNETNKDFVAVDVKTFKSLNKAVSLSEIRGNIKLETIPLIKHHRLSVMNLREEHFMEILHMANTTI